MTEPSSILVCRLSALGDVVLALPAVDALKERFPGARVEFLSREPYGRILRDARPPDALHLWAGRGHALPRAVADARWDLLVDLSATGTSRRLLARVHAGQRISAAKETLRRFAFVKLRFLGGGSVSIRPAVERMFAGLAPLGIRRGDRAPRFDVPRAAEARPVVVVAPGAGRSTKRWPEERFAEMTARLAAAGHAVLVVGSAEERLLLERVAAGADPARTGIQAVSDLGDLPRIVSRGSVALVNDSGVLHVAEACGVPVVALFGPTHPRLGFAPLRADSVVLSTNIACRPCDLHGPRTCPKKHHRCLRDLPVELVLREVTRRIPGGEAA
ncbi:MAG: glycosyltransferase family 9 protein [Candidatus Eiseniibacteriota bacterium]